jgi:hypothetical protein
MQDGFGGGDNITENVLFHTCRESSDHGPIVSHSHPYTNHWPMHYKLPYDCMCLIGA